MKTRKIIKKQTNQKLEINIHIIQKKKLNKTQKILFFF